MELNEAMVEKMLIDGKSEEEILAYVELDLPEGTKVSLKQKLQALAIELKQLEEIAEGRGDAFMDFALSDPNMRSEMLSMLESNVSEVIADVRRASRKIPMMTEEELEAYLENRESHNLESPGLEDLFKISQEHQEAIEPPIEEELEPVETETVPEV